MESVKLHEMAVTCERFLIDGTHYRFDQWGVLHEDPLVITCVYDIKYVQDYCDSIPDLVAKMSFLRSGFIKGVIGNYWNVLDVGYGNGGFLRTQRLWNLHGPECFGTDISGYPIPDGCTFLTWDEVRIKHFDVVCFFDSFEHLPDHSLLEWLKATWLVFSMPWFHDEMDLEWFRRWKHRKPGEHIHHFSPASLERMMGHYGYQWAACQDLEDGIRRPRGGISNIFTSVYKKE